MFPTSAGIPVSEKEALKYLTVYACVSLISGDVGRLPLNLYRKRKDKGKDLVTDHKLYDLLHNAPNKEMSSFNWREASQGHLLLWGNHYSFIERNMMGEVQGLWPLPDPGQVTVRRAGSEIVYEYLVDGQKVRRTRKEIFHVPGYGFNGIVGMSMIAMAREAIGMGLAAETFGSNYFSQGTHPSGLLTMEHDLGENEGEYLKALKKNYAGLGKSHSIMVLQNGEKYQPMTIPLEDAQFLETRDHQKIEVCGMYHVPPHKIAIHGQNSNYNNLEQENASYVDSCLMHWIVRWESAISLQLLTEAERRSGLFFEFQVQGLLRGDSQARAEFYNKIFQVGGITPNEIRSHENMNPVDGGDQSFVMLNMVPLDMAEELATPPEPPPAPVVEIAPEDVGTVKQKEAEAKFFQRAKDKRQDHKRSIRMRDRLARAYRPLILDAAKAIVSRETKAIKNRLVGRQSRADKDSMADFLTDFYKTFPDYITKRMGPVLMSYLNAIAEETFSEIGADIVGLDVEIRDYIKNYAERHSSGSIGQMLALLEGELSALETRADEWMEKRAEKIVADEVVRASSAAFSWVVFGAGMSMVLRNRGPKTCPYCRSMEGRRVWQDKPLINAGDELDPKDGTGPMKFYNTKFHSPLHQKCDCYMSAG